MNRKERILNLLEKEMPNFTIKVYDNSHLHVGHNNFDGFGETHILIRLTPIEKNYINRLLIHRKINDILINEFNTGLHSIEIRIGNF